MDTAYVIVTLVTIAANLISACFDAAHHRFVLGTSARVGVPVSWLRPLAAVKTAGALGLALGLSGVPVIGAAAAAGLVVFFVCALGMNLRARAYDTLQYPAPFLALAVATLVLELLR